MNLAHRISAAFRVLSSRPAFMMMLLLAEGGPFTIARLQKSLGQKSPDPVRSLAYKLQGAGLVTLHYDRRNRQLYARLSDNVSADDETIYVDISGFSIVFSRGLKEDSK